MLAREHYFLQQIGGAPPVFLGGTIRLNESYNGPIIKAVLSSGGQPDIYRPREIAQAATTGSAGVTRLYDQSGNGNDLVGPATLSAYIYQGNITSGGITYPARLLRRREDRTPYVVSPIPGPYALPVIYGTDYIASTVQALSTAVPGFTIAMLSRGNARLHNLTIGWFGMSIGFQSPDGTGNAPYKNVVQNNTASSPLAARLRAYFPLGGKEQTYCGQSIRADFGPPASETMKWRQDGTDLMFESWVPLTNNAATAPPVATDSTILPTTATSKGSLSGLDGTTAVEVAMLAVWPYRFADGGSQMQALDKWFAAKTFTPAGS